MTTDQLEDRSADRSALADHRPTPSACPLDGDLSSSAFIAVARALSERARGLGLIVPAFRTPPRTPGLDRAVRRWPGGGATVSVRRTGVPAGEVLDSMVEGVLAAGRLPRSTRERVRPILRQTAWSAAGAAPVGPVESARERGGERLDLKLCPGRLDPHDFPGRSPSAPPSRVRRRPEAA